MRRLALLLVAWLAIATPAAAQRFPKLTGLVVDEANVIPPAEEAALTAKLQALQRDTKRQLVVATIADLQGYDQADYGTRLARAWGIGLKGVDNGAVLFIAPNEPAGRRGVRREVGYGLETVLTDAWSGRMIRDTMTPLLKAGELPRALDAGADAVIGQLRRAPDEAKAQTDAAAAQFDRRTRRSGNEGGVPVALMFFLILCGVVAIGTMRGRRRRRGPWGMAQRRSSGVGNVVLWSIANELARGAARGGGSSGGGWGGGGGGGGWSGGGFTGGGGGSFGGGGASGSW